MGAVQSKGSVTVECTLFTPSNGEFTGISLQREESEEGGRRGPKVLKFSSNSSQRNARQSNLKEPGAMELEQWIQKLEQQGNHILQLTYVYMKGTTFELICMHVYQIWSNFHLN